MQTSLPALRQSLVEVAACPKSYAYQVIEGHKMPGGMQSYRGQEIHQVMAAYINHCAQRHVPADWAKFDTLAAGAGQEAAEILNGLRDNYTVDHEHVYDTELTLRWKETITIDDEEIVLEVEGILDGLFFLTELKARIDDFKSHPRPFDPDTFQALEYAFLVLMNFPQVEEVTFQLIFVRYANARRPVTFTRDDLPMLRQAVINARLRQITLHRAYEAGDEEIPAIPGAHCQYCPLLQALDCPIAEFNPHATLTLEERLRFEVWVDEIRAVNRQVLKDAVDASGRPIEYLDGNKRPIQIGFREKESQQFPLLRVLPFLFEHRDAYPEDVAWIDNLLISSTKLKSYLKTKKRAITHQAIMDNAAVTVSKTDFAVTRPAETEETERASEYEEA